MWSVGIVGGGPGGLLTAYFLERAADSPLRVTLFEASNRLGGKVYTPCFTQAPERFRHVCYEAGAAEFYDYSVHAEDPLRELIAELGLSTTAMEGSAVIMDDRIVGGLEDVREHLGPEACRALVAFDQDARNRMSPGEFYHSDHPDGAPPSLPPTLPDGGFACLLQTVADPRTRRYLETLTHSDLATEPQKTSITYGLQNYLMNDAAYMQLYSIVGGNEQLPRELAARLNATKRLNQPVTHIARDADGRLCVTSVQDGATQRDVFDFVVVALPHNHVGSISFGGEPLASAIQRHQAYYACPAHYLRMTLLFERPFWRSTLTDSFWMLDRFEGCCLYDESLRDPGSSHGVLGWLVAGDAARRMSEWDDERLIAEALDSLPSFLAHGRRYFVTGAVHRWVAAVNGRPGGSQSLRLDQRHQPEPSAHPNLLFVGDYLFDSTLNGVLDSAEYAAEWIAGRLAGEHPARG